MTGVSHINHLDVACNKGKPNPLRVGSGMHFTCTEMIRRRGYRSTCVESVDNTSQRSCRRRKDCPMRCDSYLKPSVFLQS